MSYRYDKARKNRRTWYTIASVLVILFLFTPVYSWLFDIAERPIARSWEQGNQTLADSQNFLQSFYGKKTILKRNQELAQENNRLAIDNLRTDYLAQELEKITNTQETLETPAVVASVINKGSLSSANTWIINSGIDSGITVGDRVIAYDTSVIGTVTEVFDTTARITLYSAVGQSVNGILFPHNENLMAKGQGGGGFMIETPRSIEAAPGDVFYSQENPGYVIAIVQAIEFDARDPFKQVYLSYPTNVNQIQTVVIKKTPFNNN